MNFRKFLTSAKCAATSAILAIFFCFVLFIKYGHVDGYRDIAIKEEKIESKIRSIVNFCGKDRWLMWAVIDKDLNRFNFKKVYGCNSTKADCAQDIKILKLNPFYDRMDLELDDATFSFIDRFDAGLAGFYSAEYLQRFPAIKNILENTNKKVENVGIAAAHDSIKKLFFVRNLIYVFALTSTSDKNQKCDKNTTVTMLEELSLISNYNYKE